MTVANRFRIAIDWQDEVGNQTFRTLAVMAVLVDDTVIWPSSDAEAEPFECFTDDLLSHLVENWKPLLLRQNYPISIQAERPSLLRAEAKKRWALMPAPLAETEEEQVTAFEEVHDLANAFGGIYGLPPLWLLRDRDNMIVEAGDRIWFFSHEQVTTALEEAGDKIAGRLRQAEEPGRWSRLLNAWQGRDVGEGSNLLALSIGVNREKAEYFAREGFLSLQTSVAAVANDDNELRIAARMTGLLSLEHSVNIVKLVRDCPHQPTIFLDEFSNNVRGFLCETANHSTHPFEQGVLAANYLRDWLDLPSDGRIEPFGILEQFNVDTRLLAVEPVTLDGIAVWGAHHGPSVIVNISGKRLGSARGSPERARRAGAARATAAHELCHLIFDRGLALVAVDLVNGRMPVRIEQRARAFAAELLLPSHAAGQVWRDTQQPLDHAGITKILQRLCDNFGVTRSVAAWKLEHGVDQHARIRVTAVLDELVPQRWQVAINPLIALL